MSKRGVTILAIIGVAVFIAGLLGWLAYRQARDMALSLDGGTLLRPPIEGQGCTRLEAETNLDQRVMAENESQALVLTLRLAEGPSCTFGVSLLAPNFNIAPPETTFAVTLPAGGEQDIAWVLTPQRVGTYEVVLLVDGRSETLGITVTNALGFTATQTQILSIMATFLGPMLTAPWWYDRWRERQKEKKKEEDQQTKEAEMKRDRPGDQTIPLE